MKPHDDYTNGDESAEDSSGSEAALERELSLRDEAAPARALAALNQLRKARQHYDTLLVARGAEVPAHRAVLAAASPYLLEALGGGAGGVPAYRVDDVEPEALRELVEYAYTGRLRVRDAGAALRLYRAAWRLRVEPARAHLARSLLRRLTPPLSLGVRALPDLAPPHTHQLDAYIRDHFADVCACAAFAALPLLRIDMLRETSAEDGDELPRAVADAALVWLRDHTAPDVDLEELCSRTHVLYVDGAGALRDLSELPAARGDAPELHEYRREAAARARAPRRAPPEPALDAALPALQLGARAPPADCAVLAACRLDGVLRGTRALVALRGRLAAARVVWRSAGEGWAGAARGGVLGGARAEPESGARRAPLARGRSAHGAAALGGRLLVCGGYDRARVLAAAELYDAPSNEWSPLPDMRTPRARFPLVRLQHQLYAVGGSDGHAELDTMDVWSAEQGWRAAPRVPLALSHAAGAADEARRALFVVGGWSGGLCVKRVLRYCARQDAWQDAPPLAAPRSQCAAALWRGALWALGGCDAWHCLASTETLALDALDAGAAWAPGPALPTARRSAGAAEWRGALLVAGGSDGAASLRRTELLSAGAASWRAGPALRRARAGLGLVPLDDVLYAVGGFDGKEFLACVECLYEPDGEWSTLCAPPAPAPPLADHRHQQDQ